MAKNGINIYLYGKEWDQRLLVWQRMGSTFTCMAKDGINVYLNGNKKDKRLLEWQRKGRLCG